MTPSNHGQPPENQAAKLSGLEQFRKEAPDIKDNSPMSDPNGHWLPSNNSPKRSAAEGANIRARSAGSSHSEVSRSAKSKLDMPAPDQPVSGPSRFRPPRPKNASTSLAPSASAATGPSRLSTVPKERPDGTLADNGTARGPNLDSETSPASSASTATGPSRLSTGSKEGPDGTLADNGTARNPNLDSETTAPRNPQNQDTCSTPSLHEPSLKETAGQGTLNAMAQRYEEERNRIKTAVNRSWSSCAERCESRLRDIRTKYLKDLALLEKEEKEVLEKMDREQSKAYNKRYDFT